MTPGPVSPTIELSRNDGGGTMEHPSDGLTFGVRDDGKIEILLWRSGEQIHSMLADPETVGPMAANLLNLALESAERTGRAPINPSAKRPSHPSVLASAAGLVLSAKKKKTSLGFVFGQTQLVIGIPPSILRPLGEKMIAASAETDKSN